MVASLPGLSKHPLLDRIAATGTVRCVPFTSFRQPRRVSRRFVLLGLLFPMLALPASASPPVSRTERVRQVIEFFDSPEAAAAVRAAAELDPRTLAASVGTSSWGTDLTAAGFDVEYDYFDPVAPGSLPASFDEPLPGTRELTEDLIAAGALRCPVVASRFSDTWGAPRPNGRVHVGTDMVAPYGTPVFAIADSVVLRVDRVDSFVAATDTDPGGLSVTLLSSWGDVFYYGHFASIAPEAVPGARFLAGAQIGILGASGNASLSVPHVHLQWHPLAGSPQNPFWVLRSICG